MICINIQWWQDILWQQPGAGWGHKWGWSQYGLDPHQQLTKCWVGYRCLRSPGICRLVTTWGRRPPESGRSRRPPDAQLPGRHGGGSYHCGSHCTQERQLWEGCIESDESSFDRCKLPGQDVRVPRQGANPSSMAGHASQFFLSLHIPQLEVRN